MAVFESKCKHEVIARTVTYMFLSKNLFEISPHCYVKGIWAGFTFLNWEILHVRLMTHCIFSEITVAPENEDIRKRYASLIRYTPQKK